MAGISRVTFRGFAAAVATLALAAIAANELRWTCAFAQEKFDVAGVSNFGRVDGRLYRGGQPNDQGFRSLKQLGVNTVIAFTIGEAGVAEERRQVEALGMAYVNLPWSAVREPTNDQVAAFLAFLRAHPERTVFVHCWQGIDRTGTMVALYRIAVDRWSIDGAIDEMKAFHYHYIFQPHLQHYVERFAAAESRTPSEWSRAATGGLRLTSSRSRSFALHGECQASAFA